MKDIYLELKEVVKFDKRKVILIEDIADVYADQKIKSKILKLPVIDSKFEREVVKSINVIKTIKINFPTASINNIGSESTLIIFNDKKENKLLTVIKITIGSLITFFGAFVAIMTFQTDVSLAETLRNIYFLLTGTNVAKPYLIQIPYSVGIALGSITFYMKFKNKSISPLEIELDKYEKDIKASECKKLESQGKC